MITSLWTKDRVSRKLLKAFYLRQIAGPLLSRIKATKSFFTWWRFSFYSVSFLQSFFFDPTLKIWHCQQFPLVLSRLNAARSDLDRKISNSWNRWGRLFRQVQIASLSDIARRNSLCKWAFSYVTVTWKREILSLPFNYFSVLVNFYSADNDWQNFSIWFCLKNVSHFKHCDEKFPSGVQYGKCKTCL